MHHWSALALLFVACSQPAAFASISIADEDVSISPADRQEEHRDDIPVVSISGSSYAGLLSHKAQDYAPPSLKSVQQPSWPRRLMKYGPIGRRTSLIKLLFGSNRTLSGESYADIPTEEENLSVEVPETDLYRVLVFITAAFVMGHIAIRLGMVSVIVMKWSFCVGTHVCLYVRISNANDFMMCLSVHHFSLA